MSNASLDVRTAGYGRPGFIAAILAFLDRVAVINARNGAVEPFGL